MMTEEEAKTKWCPFVTTGDQRDRCLASGCMAWCWANDVLESARMGGGAPGTKKNDVGYCARTGRP